MAVLRSICYNKIKSGVLMDGNFVRSRKNKLISWILVISCAALTCMFLLEKDKIESSELIPLLVIIALGVIGAALSIGMNAGAYFHIRKNKIKARYGLFGRIDCSMDEIEYALPRNNELIIGMKDGKHHTITEISNSYELSSAIRRQIFTLETETPDVLAAQLNENETSFNKRMIWMALGGGAVFIGYAFIVSLLTGGRELSEFTNADWDMFIPMGIGGVLTAIIYNCALIRRAKRMTLIDNIIYCLHGAVIATEPLSCGNAESVYTDENYEKRIIVCSFPNDKGVYYCVQTFDDYFQLETTYTSRIYANKDELPEDVFSKLIDITSNIQKSGE